jgi:hypothetical protein
VRCRSAVSKKAHETLAIAMNRTVASRTPAKAGGRTDTRRTWRLAAAAISKRVGAVRGDDGYPVNADRVADQDGAGREAEKAGNSRTQWTT